MNTRRDFLEKSLFAAAAAVMAGELPQARAEDTAKKPASPNERLRVACVGVHGRGKEHLQAFGGLHDCEVVAIVDVDEAVGKSTIERFKKRLRTKRAGLLPRHPQDARGQDDRHRVDRHAQPLALAGRDLGDAGRQGRLRRKAGQPQRQRRTAARPGGPQARADLPGGHAVPFQSRHARADEVRPRRQDRRGQAGSRAVLQASRLDRPEGQLLASQVGRLRPVVRTRPRSNR